MKINNSYRRTISVFAMSGFILSLGVSVYAQVVPVPVPVSVPVPQLPVPVSIPPVSIPSISKPSVSPSPASSPANAPVYIFYDPAYPVSSSTPVEPLHAAAVEFVPVPVAVTSTSTVASTTAAARVTPTISMSDWFTRSFFPSSQYGPVGFGRGETLGLILAGISLIVLGAFTSMGDTLANVFNFYAKK